MFLCWALRPRLLAGGSSTDCQTVPESTVALHKYLMHSHRGHQLIMHVPPSNPPIYNVQPAIPAKTVRRRRHYYPPPPHVHDSAGHRHVPPDLHAQPACELVLTHSTHWALDFWVVPPQEHSEPHLHVTPQVPQSE